MLRVLLLGSVGIALAAPWTSKLAELTEARTTELTGTDCTRVLTGTGFGPVPGFYEAGDRKYVAIKSSQHVGQRNNAHLISAAACLSSVTSCSFTTGTYGLRLTGGSYSPSYQNNEQANACLNTLTGTTSFYQRTTQGYTYMFATSDSAMERLNKALARGWSVGPVNIRVLSASMSASSGNRDGGMNLINSCYNGQTQGETFFRYRTGGSTTFTATLTIAAGSAVSGVEMLVKSGQANQQGFSGISVSAGGQSLSRNAMYGTYARRAAYTNTASDFAWNSWMSFDFPSTATGVSAVTITFQYADQDGDNCVSFNGIKIMGPASTSAPTQPPTPNPTFHPSPAPSFVPTSAPTPAPSGSPSDVPTLTPTEHPTTMPTAPPTAAPVAWEDLGGPNEKCKYETGMSNQNFDLAGCKAQAEATGYKYISHATSCSSLSEEAGCCFFSNDCETGFKSNTANPWRRYVLK